jgi:hypothetical protein
VTEGIIPCGSNKYRCEVISCIPKKAIVKDERNWRVVRLSQILLHFVEVGQSQFFKQIILSSEKINRPTVK